MHNSPNFKALDRSEELGSQSHYSFMIGSMRDPFHQLMSKKADLNLSESVRDVLQQKKRKSSTSQISEKPLFKPIFRKNQAKDSNQLKEEKETEIDENFSLKKDLIRSGELLRKNTERKPKNLNLVKLKIPLNKNNYENDEQKEEQINSLLIKSVQVGGDMQFERNIQFIKKKKKNQIDIASECDSPYFAFSEKKKSLSIEDFEQIQKIGQGGYGEVFLVRHTITGTVYALKAISKQLINNQKMEENLFRQIKIHSHIDDKNILKLYKVFHDKGYVYMLLQYMIGGTLWQLKRKNHHLSEAKVSKVVGNVCRGLKALHEKQIIHRDVKLQNIMLTDGVAKLGDFGCAVHSICMRKSKIGSIGYLSPEQLNHHFYNKKIDIWSMGIVTYELLFGNSPYEKEILDLLKKDETQFLSLSKLNFPEQPKISDQAKDFISKTLQHKVNARIDIDQALQHPFLQKKNDKKK